MGERDYSWQDNTIAKTRSTTQWVIVFAKFDHFDFMNVDKYVLSFIYSPMGQTIMRLLLEPTMGEGDYSWQVNIIANMVITRWVISFFLAILIEKKMKSFVAF